MTEEEKAEEYITKNCDRWEADCLTVDEIVRSSLVEFATEVTKELQEEPKNHWYEMYELECLKTKELEAQIEKMKCCENCKKYFKCGSSRYVCEEWSYCNER